MVIALLVCVVVLCVVHLVQLRLARRPQSAGDPAQLQAALQLVERSAERTERSLRDELGRTREEAALVARQGREELAHPIAQMTRMLDARLVEIRAAGSRQAEQVRFETGSATKQLRDDVVTIVDTLGRAVSERVHSYGTSQKEQLELMQRELARLTSSTETRLEGLTASNAQRMEQLRTAVETKLGALQEDNGKQLEQMRLTVDQKLHGTLEKRLGESFQQVSDRLEQVHKGLGEMQVLANGVGDLKRVLGNVKVRGTWGEVQLGALLAQVLTAEQYEENVSLQGNGERVEFAVKMPGRGARDESVWLPIDAKFPIEDYHRMIEAQEAGDRAAQDTARAQLELRIKACAKQISDKYICPPKTTDFAILFLPSEGLFIEAMRTGALSEVCQQQHRVVLAGPTTLWSILSSLQMGFRTLAIQKRSSEVWDLLAGVKTEWTKYGDTLEKVQRKLKETTNAVDDVAKRGRAIERRLRHVDKPSELGASAIMDADAFDAAEPVAP